MEVSDGGTCAFARRGARGDRRLGAFERGGRDAAVVARLDRVVADLQSPSRTATAPDQLLVVVFKTDQVSVQRRLATILAAAEPSDTSTAYTQAVVVAFPIGEVSQADLDALGVLVTPDAVAELRITPTPAPVVES
jgi:hypothetical protein